MSDQNNGQVFTLQRPTTSNREDWQAYWKQLGQSWRTEPEIDEERQKYLTERRTIVPDTVKGVSPFKGVKLSRADVEWLLATHENGRGPIDWSDEGQRSRKGLDLRGAIFRGINLSALPLARLRGGLSQEELRTVSIVQREALIEAAAIHFEEAGIDSILFDWRFLSYPEDEGLCDTHLEGAELSGAFLTKATMVGTFLMEANLHEAHLEETDLREGHLEKAKLDLAYLMKAHLNNAKLARAGLMHAHMDGASLPEADLEGADLYEVSLNEAHMYKACLKGVRLYHATLNSADLREAHLEEADLTKASLEGASLIEAHLEGADLEYAHLEGADLLRAHLEGAWCYRAFFDAATRLNGVTLSDEKNSSVSLAEVVWGNVNLSVVKWSQVKMLGDEHRARQRKSYGREKDGDVRLYEYERAVRAYRQLSIVLQAQGLNEDAAHFSYRAQILQREVFTYQRKFGQYLLSLFLDLLAGFGYKPWRSFAAYLIVIATFATAYFIIGRTVGPTLSPLVGQLPSPVALRCPLVVANRTDASRNRVSGGCA